MLWFDSKGHALTGLYELPVFSYLKFSRGSVPPDLSSRPPNFVTAPFESLTTGLNRFVTEEDTTSLQTLPASYIPNKHTARSLLQILQQSYFVNSLSLLNHLPPGIQGGG